MGNIFQELRLAIYAKGSVITGLTGGFWFVGADQNTKDNYSVFSFVTNTNTRDTATLFEKVYLQINVYSQDRETLETLVENMKAAFDDTESSWSLASYNFIRIERNFVRGPVDLDYIFQTTIQYEIDLQKK